MARMLGRWRSGGCGYGVPGPDCAGHERDTRRRKRAEAREVEREADFIAAEGWHEVEVLTGPFRVKHEGPPAAFLDAHDLSVIAMYDADCRHGCNGDCIVLGSASELCTWQCHPGLENDPERTARAAELESRFANGGIIPGGSRDDDSVPAVLRRGCGLVSKEQAGQMGLRVDWLREHPGDAGD